MFASCRGLPICRTILEQIPIKHSLLFPIGKHMVNLKANVGCIWSMKSSYKEFVDATFA